MAVIDTGTNTLGMANVDSAFNVQVNPPGVDALGVDRGGGSANAGAAAIFSEVDAGTKTGARLVVSPETDDDYRLRLAASTMMDQEIFNYTAQNTGKHNYLNVTLTAAWTATGLQTNSGAITTASTAARVRTYAYLPLLAVEVLAVTFEANLSTAVAATDTTADVGLFSDGGASPYAPTDGVYFRFTSAGVRGVLNFNGVETPSALFSGFTAVPGTNYTFAISLVEGSVRFWIDDVLYAEVPTPDANGQPFASACLPFAVRHAIGVAGAGASFQLTIVNYDISLGGSVFSGVLSEIGNRLFGGHQTLSGAAASGELTNYTNSTTPAAVAAANSAPNAALVGLGGEGHVTATGTAATDLIINSYQVPDGSVSIQGKRLVIHGVRISALNLGATVAVTETSHLYTLNFGGTSDNLATAEAASTKKRRAEALGTLSWPIGAVIGAGPREGSIYMPFLAPIWVNPGEYVQIALKVLRGTATTNQTIFHTIVFDYGWE